MNNFTLAALIAAGAALWQQIRSVFGALAGLFVTTAIVRAECATAMRLYLNKKAKWSKWGRKRCYLTCGAPSPKTGRWEQLPGEFIGHSPAVYWVGWRPIFVTVPSNYSSGHSEGQEIHILCFRFLFDLDALILAAMNELQEFRNRPTGRFRICHMRRRIEYGAQNGQQGGAIATSPPLTSAVSSNFFDLRPLGWNCDDLLPKPNDAGSIEELALSPNALALVARVLRWKKSEQWFKSHHVPWKLGFCLHGNPGTGKTALIRAIGRLLDIPVFVFDLATYDNPTFSKAWEDAVCESPCLMVFEDLDAVYEGRQNIAHPGNMMTSPLDFSCLLNALDGLQVNNGVLIAGTTNRIDVLDSALLRPGRFDVSVEMPKLTIEGRQRIAERILTEWPDEQSAAVAIDRTFSGSEFQELCTKRAQELFWAA